MHLPLVAMMALLVSTSPQSWVEDTLGKLPASIAAPNKTPWTIRRNAILTPAGVGTTSSTIGDATNNRVQLYALSPENPSQAHAQQRALLYSIFYTLDKTKKWSQRPEWRQINGWQGYLTSYLEPTPHSKNLQTPGYWIHANQQNPTHDFASFMSWYLTEQKPNDGESPLCLYLSHARMANTLLTEADPNFPLPLTDPYKECRRFKKWAQYDALDRIEINYATPLTKTATSSFGHIYLRMAYKSSSGFHPIAHSKSISFLANTSSHAEGSPGYILGGLFGRFRARLHVQPFLETYQTYIVKERRDIIQWKINFSESETKQFLERVWTLNNKAEYRYFFLQENCSTLLVDLINSVLPIEKQIKQPGVFGKGPTKALDQLALVQTQSGSGLLTLIPNRLLSMKSAAAQANQRLKKIEAQLSENLRNKQYEILKQAHSENESIRAETYQKLKPLFRPLIPKYDRLIRDYFLERGIIESYYSARDNTEREKQSAHHYAKTIRKLRSSLPENIKKMAQHLSKSALPKNKQIWFISTTDSLLEDLSESDDDRRHEGYQAARKFIADLSKSPYELQSFIAQLRCASLLFVLLNNDNLNIHHPKLFDALFFPTPDLTLANQPYIAPYKHMFRNANSTVVSKPLLALQDAKTYVLSNNPAKQSTYLATSNFLTSSDHNLALRDYERSYPHGKIDNLSAAAGSFIPNGEFQKAHAQLTFVSAIYSERLGAPTRHGNKGDKALTLFSNESRWKIQNGLPKFQGGALLLLGYREMVIGELEVEPSPLGWELYTNVEFNPWKELRKRYILGAAAIVQLAASRRLVDHLLLTQGVNLEHRLVQSPSPKAQWGFNLPVGSEMRLGLDQENSYKSLALKANLHPFWALGSPTITLSWQAQAEFTYPLFDRFSFFNPTQLGIGLWATVAAAGADLLEKNNQVDLRASVGLRIH